MILLALTYQADFDVEGERSQKKKWNPFPCIKSALEKIHCARSMAQFRNENRAWRTERRRVLNKLLAAHYAVIKGKAETSN